MADSELRAPVTQSEKVEPRANEWYKYDRDQDGPRRPVTPRSENIPNRGQTEKSVCQPENILHYEYQLRDSSRSASGTELRPNKLIDDLTIDRLSGKLRHDRFHHRAHLLW
jgi:hypothetical protein